MRPLVTTVTWICNAFQSLSLFLSSARRRGRGAGDGGGSGNDENDGLIRLQRGAAIAAAPSFVLSCSVATPFVWPMLSYPRTIRGILNQAVVRGTRPTDENVNPGLVLSN